MASAVFLMSKSAIGFSKFPKRLASTGSDHGLSQEGLHIFRRPCQNQGFTRKTTLLLSVPLGVVTWTLPVVAPVGTVVLISVRETTVNLAGVPLKVTLVAPVRLVPKIWTGFPTLAEVGFVSTKGPRPADKLKTVPSLADP